MSVLAFSAYAHELSQLLSNVEVTTDSTIKQSLDEGIKRSLLMILSKKTGRNRIFVIGNGGSAAIASHMQNDLCKSVGVRSLVFHETPLLSALSNDQSYSEAFEILVSLWAEKGDLLIAISSSGQSENILRAADAAMNKGCDVITLSGFKMDNPLRKKGLINFYVPSDQYGFVEPVHSILAHYLSDSTKFPSENQLS